MLVYGDPQKEVALTEALAQLEQLLPAARSCPEAARKFLILAGQLEQGIADHLDLQMLEEPAELLTDTAAENWLSLCDGLRTEAALEKPLLELCGQANALPERTLQLKLPEGFCFYALFPEQYAATAARWSEEQSNRGNVLVVGLRSIGTTLSAVVHQILLSRGWISRRLTCRPGGHPWCREVELPNLEGFEHLIVVDEGPGLSGSSMAAVAEAAASQGMALSRVSFFPAHLNGPGYAAGDSVRLIWEVVPRFITPLETTSWSKGADRAGLLDLLRRCTQEITQKPVTETLDMSGGKWRFHCYPETSSWPSIYPRLERPKYLFRNETGEGLLWKFTGLLPVLEPQAASAVTIPIKSEHLGFTAFPWIEGRRLNLGDLTPELLDQILDHVLAVAGPPLSPSEAQSAARRLKQIVETNFQESFGHRPSLAIPDGSGLPSYGDGRLAPHEWIRQANGKHWKADVGGHDRDHTVVGPQPILWDLAGLCIEWELEEQQRLLAAQKIGCDPGILRPYFLAYGAFKLGLLHFTQQATDGSERDRARVHSDRLKRLLLNLLSS